MIKCTFLLPQQFHMLSYTHSDVINIGDHTKLFRQDFKTCCGKPYEKTNKTAYTNNGEALPNNNELMQKDNSFYWFIFHVERILCICWENLVGCYEWYCYCYTRTEKNCCCKAHVKYRASIDVLLIELFLI